jgi:hypothetical protein
VRPSWVSGTLFILRVDIFTKPVKTRRKPEIRVSQEELNEGRSDFLKLYELTEGKERRIGCWLGSQMDVVFARLCIELTD